MSVEENAVKGLEAIEDLILLNRSLVRLLKAENGRHLSPAGRALAEYAAHTGMTHREIAKLLQTTRGGVSAYLRKIADGTSAPVLSGLSDASLEE